MVFVAINDARRPVAVPAWTPHTDQDRRLAGQASERLETRSAIQRAMARQDYIAAGTGPRTVLRFLATPSDINWGGKTHGGIIMRWIDEAASVCATSWAGRPAVAVYSGGIRFLQPSPSATSSRPRPG